MENEEKFKSELIFSSFVNRNFHRLIFKLKFSQIKFPLRLQLSNNALQFSTNSFPLNSKENRWVPMANGKIEISPYSYRIVSLHHIWHNHYADTLKQYANKPDDDVHYNILVLQVWDEFIHNELLLFISRSSRSCKCFRRWVYIERDTEGEIKLNSNLELHVFAICIVTKPNWTYIAFVAVC